MQMNIINEPETAKDYEFIVVQEVDNDTWLFIGAYENGFDAEEKAKSVGGVIIHNVRIQGKRKKIEKKRYEFSGTWYWDCWAKNEEDAIRQFENACPEDFDIDFNNYSIDLD